MSKPETAPEGRIETGLHRRRVLQAGGALALGATGFAGAARADASRAMVYAYANWSDALAITFVAKQLIETHFGYKVHPLQADPGVIYAALKSGKADVFSNCYMQGLEPLKGIYRGGQAEYVKRVADAIKILGVSEGPMTQGLAVPDYVTIKSIADLNQAAGKFRNGIVGIDPGSGLMHSVDATVKGYDLKIPVTNGSEAAMEAAFQRAYERKEWIVVASWQPLPMWSKFKMRYLEDPKQTMMAEPYYCFHAARNDFQSNFPKAYAFFQKFHIPNNEEAVIMGWIDGGMEPAAAAAKWIKQTTGKGIIEPWLA
jgi:glycine betaine/proline transport system substrate-binding protein